jgi:hypothetical protein
MLRWCLPLLLLLAGCQLVPRVAREAEVRNPFPQLSKVAVVEFFNGTSDDTAFDGLEFAIAYASELQRIQGFEVVPPDIVRKKMQTLKLNKADLADPGRRRLLAETLEVDALVLGTVTEFSTYYPPRLGMKVSWYAANPCFHPIPAGYGLPWGTPEEEEIPDSLLYEAELALAKEQMKTQTPSPDDDGTPRDPALTIPAVHATPADAKSSSLVVPATATATGAAATANGKTSAAADASGASAAKNAATTATLGAAGAAVAAPAAGAIDATSNLPADWPDPRGFVPQAPCAVRPQCIPSSEPIITHTRMYHGNDAQFTAALQNYYNTRDEARFGGWQTYLQRSSDFIRFCCHLHICETLTARGGAGKTRVAYRWSDDR